MQPQTIVLAQAALDYATDTAGSDLAADLTEVQARIVKAKQGVGRSYVEQISKGVYPGTSYLQTASWLADLSAFADAVASSSGLQLVSKEGVSTDQYEQWANRKVRRVGGRFARSSTPAGPESFSGPRGSARAKRLKDRKVALPGGLEWGPDDSVRWQGNQVPASQQTQHRAEQWLGAQRTADELQRELKAAFGSDAALINLKVNILDPDRPDALKVANIDDYDPTMGDAVSLGFDIDEHRMKDVDESTKQRVRNHVRLLTGLGQAGQGFAEVDEPLANAAQALGRPGSLRDNKRSTASAMAERAGRLLAGFGPTQGVGETLQALGVMGNSRSAQALEPYVERAAARYTGTQVKPSPIVVGLFGEGAKLGEVESWSEAELAERVRRAQTSMTNKPAAQTGDRNVAGLSPAIASTVSRRERGARGDRLFLGVRSDLGAFALGRSLPADPMLNVLSQRAGKTLPSRGLIIGEDGNVHAEAVGQSDDHYTPFSAAMLGSLEGGQFVRSRQRGGPSVEDLRTLLSTGARMATVVSPSGVFEIELAPEARGAKRYGPQMQSMTDAYRRLLDTIASNALGDKKTGAQYLGQLDPKDAQRIEALAARNPAQADDIRQRERAKALANAAANAAGLDRAEMYEQTLAQARTLSDSQRSGMSVDEYARAMVDAEISSRVRPLMLNGEGYNLALRTLQARFPHLIRSVQYRDNYDFARDLGFRSNKEAGLPRSGGQDQGYLEPGRVKTFGGVNPRQARANREEAVTSGPAGPVGPAGTPPTGGARPGAGEPPSAASPAPGPQATPLPAESGPKQVAMRQGIEALNVLRSSGNAFKAQVAQLGATNQGWTELFNNQEAVRPSGEVVAGTGQPPASYTNAKARSDNQNDQFVAPLYVAMRMSLGTVDSLVDEMSSEPRIGAAILAMTPEEVSDVFLDANVQATITEKDGYKGDAKDVADAVAEQVINIAELHQLANPSFVEAPGDAQTLSQLSADQLPLPAALASVEDVQGYVDFANSDDFEATKAREGRQMLLRDLADAQGLELLQRMRATKAGLSRRLDQLAKDLQGKDATGAAEAVVASYSDITSAVTNPEVRENLGSVYPDVREEAIQHLKGALGLGYATVMFQAALEVGGADPKALAGFLPRLRIETQTPSSGQALVADPHPAGLLTPVDGGRVALISKSRAGTTWSVLRQRVLSCV